MPPEQGFPGEFAPGEAKRYNSGNQCVLPSWKAEHPLVDKTEINRLQSYFRKLFRLDTIVVQGRANKDDSAEVSIGDEFIGVVFRDEDEGEVSYAFNMAILDIDLPDA